MGLKDLGAVKDTADVTLYHPATGQPLLNGDGSEMTVTIYGPYSAHYKKIEREQQNRRFARAQRAGRMVTMTAEQLEAEQFEMLVKNIAAWNITLGEAPEPFSVETAREALTEFPWVRDQVMTAFGDTGAFLAPSKAK